MSRIASRILAAGVLAAAAVGCAGCAGTAASTSTPVPRHPGAARHRHHRRRRPQKPARPSRAAGRRGLAPSTASATVVQRQPPPGSCHARGRRLFSLPDPRCTPGAIDPRVTQANIQETICRYGYTDTVRPGESITEPEKEASLTSYGDPGALSDYEYDHLVPLELGGARNDPRNLWPEPGASPNPKDNLEYRLNELVCDGSIALATAQLEIARNWVAAYHRLIGHR